MAGDGSEVLSDELHRWVEEKASELDMSREEVVARMLAAVGDEVEAPDGEGDGLFEDADLAALDDRLVTVEDAGVDPERVADLADRVEELTERLAEMETGTDEADREMLLDRLDRLDDRVAGLDDRVAGLDADLDEKIDDVRERVIQVKREADGKASTDHDHSEIREMADSAAATAADLRNRTDELESRVDEGFDNFEEVLEYLTEASDELEAKATTLARAAIDLRERVVELEAEQSARAVAADIRAKANRNGDATATCEDCSRTVRLGLLSKPECPHCTTAFEDLEPSRGLFGSATLLTGPPPALDGETMAPAPESPDDLFGDDANEAEADADE